MPHDVRALAQGTASVDLLLPQRQQRSWTELRLPI